MNHAALRTWPLHRDVVGAADGVHRADAGLENRLDTVVVDEPLYAFNLDRTASTTARDEVIAASPPTGGWNWPG